MTAGTPFRGSPAKCSQMVSESFHNFRLSNAHLFDRSRVCHGDPRMCPLYVRTKCNHALGQYIKFGTGFSCVYHFGDIGSRHPVRESVRR